GPDPLPKTNQDRIVRAEKLMSSDPSMMRRVTGARRYDAGNAPDETRPISRDGPNRPSPDSRRRIAGGLASRVFGA
ncbi:MAG: hypothetical protein K2Z80_24175, partial [Xanthobacteraceae bacterium]|nr:hypothetical protein [Xanthobacteraceae bacterium]